MQVIERKKGSFKALMFKADFTTIGKLYTDVSEIYFIIKQNAANDDSAAIMVKTMADGITIDSESQIVVPWGTNEYDDFTLNRLYILGIFPKFSGDPVADEDIKQEFQIKITQDLLHDN